MADNPGLPLRLDEVLADSLDRSTDGAIGARRTRAMDLAPCSPDGGCPISPAARRVVSGAAGAAAYCALRMGLRLLRKCHDPGRWPGGSAPGGMAAGVAPVRPLARAEPLAHMDGQPLPAGVSGSAVSGDRSMVASHRARLVAGRGLAGRFTAQSGDACAVSSRDRRGPQPGGRSDPAPGTFENVVRYRDTVHPRRMGNDEFYMAGGHMRSDVPGFGSARESCLCAALFPWRIAAFRARPVFRAQGASTAEDRAAGPSLPDLRTRAPGRDGRPPPTAGPLGKPSVSNPGQRCGSGKGDRGGFGRPALTTKRG